VERNKPLKWYEAATLPDEVFTAFLDEERAADYMAAVQSPEVFKAFYDCLESIATLALSIVKVSRRMSVEEAFTIIADKGMGDDLVEMALYHYRHKDNEPEKEGGDEEDGTKRENKGAPTQ